MKKITLNLVLLGAVIIAYAQIDNDYNQNHVHKSLANMTPLEFLNHHSKKIPYFAVGF